METWCKFRKAEAESKPFQHKNCIPIAVMEAIKPVFRPLANPDPVSYTHLDVYKRQVHWC